MAINEKEINKMVERIEGLCKEKMVRCPATSDQASLKAMAQSILTIMESYDALRWEKDIKK